LQALFQQRIYRDLARRRGVAARVFPMLSGSVRAEATAIVHANAAVFAHANPVPPTYRMLTRPPPPAAVLLRFYRQAEHRFGVPWQILAAVNYVETKFGRVVSHSSAGAQGPMQFLPSTWAAYGLGGDIRDPHDAILGAANYLHANGAPDDVRGALYHYNPVDAYVEAVATYAAAIRRDPRLFYDLYCWQVYMLTTRGDRRVTGPGLSVRSTDG
jgi:soluble lytic murein transglycosylase-like protein